MAQGKICSKLNELQEAGVKRQGFSKKSDREKISCEVKSIFTHPTRYFALMRAKEIMEKYESVYPKFTQKLEDALACFSFPQVHRKKIRTTNNLERFNEKIRRRTK